jgi:hypothetical protein
MSTTEGDPHDPDGSKGRLHQAQSFAREPYEDS